MVHDDPPDPVRERSPAVLAAANLVTLTATITDGDLDTDTATRDIGDAFKFEDDGPSIDPSAAAVPTLMVDDTDSCRTTAVRLVCGPVHVWRFGNDGFKDADNNDVEDAGRDQLYAGHLAGACQRLIDTLPTNYL